MLLLPLRCRTCLVVSCRESLSLCVWGNQQTFTWSTSLRPTWTLSRDWWPPGSLRGPPPPSKPSFIISSSVTFCSFPPSCVWLQCLFFLFAGTSSTLRRLHLWWSTTSSWRHTWLTESLCSMAFHPRTHRLTRKNQNNFSKGYFTVALTPCHRDDDWNSPQSPESAGWDEPVSVAAGNHI